MYRQLSSSPKKNSTKGSHKTAKWVRGVNVGGWLMLERYITPYQFAVTDCHLRGDLCWYPGQLSAPPTDSPDYQLCDFYKCKPVRREVFDGTIDFPVDEYTLAAAFPNPKDAARWLNHHFDNFISFNDIVKAKAGGVTHVRVPIPHWILGDIHGDEPWIAGDRWKYFARFCRWCRTVGIEVWPDIHTAPGSQNGFDNSGRSSTVISCKGWSDNATHVERSLNVLREVSNKILEEGLQDVVTGFGLLNEPFKDCDRKVYLRFMDDGLNIVRSILGQDTAIYVGDMFLAKTYNNGKWNWLGLNNATADVYQDTYLDSHFYQVFAEGSRAISPRQHIAFVCQNEARDTESCCYDDFPVNKTPARGVKRMVGEWSAACDTLPKAKLADIMDSIATDYIAIELDRQLSPSRQEFLLRFVQAQMVTYEAARSGVSGAWFYWTLKMEGGAFAEWDFLRGQEHGWIPKIPPPNTTSESLYGTCYDIIFLTDDSLDILKEFPDPLTSIVPDANWLTIDDDVVLTHGQSLLHGGSHNPIQPIHHGSSAFSYLLFITAACFVLCVVRFFWKKRNRKFQYSAIDASPPSISI